MKKVRMAVAGGVVIVLVGLFLVGCEINVGNDTDSDSNHDNTIILVSTNMDGTVTTNEVEEAD